MCHQVEGEGPSANAVDWMCLHLARLMAIPVPTPYLVNITPDLTRHTTDGELKDLITRSLGMNLGVGFIRGGSAYTRRAKDRATPALRRLIYLFDVLFLNIDRTDHNPNMVSAGVSLYCIDFASAMGVKQLITGHRVSEETLLPLIRRHPFYTNKAKLDISIPAVAEKRIRKIVHSTPVEWLAGVTGKALTTGICEMLANHKALLARRLSILDNLPIESVESINERTLRNREAFVEKLQRERG